MTDRKGLLRRLWERLAKTRLGFIGRIRDLFSGRSRLNEEQLEELEEILLSADVGVSATQHIIAKLREAHRQTPLEGEAVVQKLQEIVLETVGEDEFELAVDDDSPRPFVILVVGVNGAGKSTTIGKLATDYVRRGLKVTLVAGDTFRAAAIEQLEVWAKRSGADCVRGNEGADPASVAYAGVSKAIQDKADVVMIDTAGRLHTKKHLMAELDKINRVVKKLLPDAPHETVLILDATTGQNAIQQAREFNELVKISAIIMTKLDGTAKGGVLVAIRHLFDIPIVKIGIGEGQEDLRDFIPGDFVKALFGEKDLEDEQDPRDDEDYEDEDEADEGDDARGR
jgi:fused signal recognition particle receptor